MIQGVTASRLNADGGHGNLALRHGSQHEGKRATGIVLPPQECACRMQLRIQSLIKPTHVPRCSDCAQNARRPVGKFLKGLVVCGFANFWVATSAKLLVRPLIRLLSWPIDRRSILLYQRSILQLCFISAFDLAVEASLMDLL